MIMAKIVVTVSEGKLMVDASGNLMGTFELGKTGENRFKALGAPQEVVFDFKLEGGKAARVLVSVSGQGPFPFERE